MRTYSGELTEGQLRQIQQGLNIIPELVDPATENCGFFFYDDLEGFRIIQCKNIHNNPVDFCSISQSDYLKYVAGLGYEGRAKGFWHTHNKINHLDILNEFDIKLSKKEKLAFYLYHTLTEKKDYYDPDLLHPYPLTLLENNVGSPKDLEFYLNWSFENNRSDCYSLVRAWFAGRLDIILDDFPRGTLDDLALPNWRVMLDNLPKQGFKRIRNKEDLRLNDLILMSLNDSGNYHHLAIALDNKTLLHNTTPNRVSETATLNSYWLDRVESGSIWRHTNFIQ